MKIINFTAVEILPSLLDRTKVQTIRPAWKETDLYEKLEPTPKHPEGVIIRGNWFKSNKRVFEEKPPTYKVGNKIKLYWQQRSKYKKFCSNCGKGEDKDITLAECNYCHSSIIYFDKLLGTAEIMEVFKIEIKKVKKGFNIISPENYGDMDELAKFDGFISANDMFGYLDKKYDLSQPKAFWVYRWKWG